jgi:hypothetical protein
MYSYGFAAHAVPKSREGAVRVLIDSFAGTAPLEDEPTDEVPAEI